jgi:ferritin-like metal-binding protein YciE
MVAMAKACGQKELATLLAETLAEEKQTDEKLSQLAEREVNPAAIESARQEEPANDKRSGRRSTAA